MSAAPTQICTACGVEKSMARFPSWEHTVCRMCTPEVLTPEQLFIQFACRFHMKHQRPDLIRRDYYRVETCAGARAWLFRRRGDGKWFLHGWFD